MLLVQHSTLVHQIGSGMQIVMIRIGIAFSFTSITISSGPRECFKQWQWGTDGSLEHLQEFSIPNYHSYFFLAKTEKTFSNSSPSQIAIYAEFEKRASARVYMRARIRGASVRIRRGGRA